MRSIITCVSQQHDEKLLLLAAAVCIVGVYATLGVTAHARTCNGRDRLRWAAVSIVSAGCTAWATHFILLLAFRPGMTSGFEPVLTGVSLLTAIVMLGLGMGVLVTAGTAFQRFLAGVIIGVGVTALHYLGQAAYVVVGDVSWDWPLVLVSVPASVLGFGVALVVDRMRGHWIHHLGAPIVLLSIVVLHFSGMTAWTITFNPRRSLPLDAISPQAIAPIVAGVSVGLLLLAIAAFKFSLDARARQRRDRQRLSELANVALEGLLICDGTIVVTANDSFERLSGHDRSALAGRCASELLARLDLLGMPEHEEREGELACADGQFVPVRVLRSEVVVGSKTQTVFAIRDQRERLRTEAKIRTLAYHDALTGLPNRTRFFDMLALHAASRRGVDRAFAVLMIDLDRFKPVNDMLGHAAGDLLLSQVAERLNSTVRTDDLVGRLGGDEFAVLQRSTSGASDATALAQRCIDALSRPFTIDGHVLHVGASVGVTIAPADGDDATDLLHNADLALYAAKTAGRGAFRVYAPELNARVQERRRLEEGLWQALSRGEFELNYQPLVDARTQQISSAEALVRWRHPMRGLMQPADFIPLAEETGLIIPLGEWVLRAACTEAATWPSHIGVAVNLSPAQFRDLGLVATILRTLDATGLAPHRLELEITEGVLIADEKRVLDTLNRLRAAGIRISMDDFGTGYSSLSYLRRFPFDKIKVDRCFIQQTPSDPESSALVRAIINMGACLGMATTVEGVETPEQLAFTASEGCDFVQGYLISQPLPAGDLAALIKGWATPHAPDLSMQVEAA